MKSTLIRIVSRIHSFIYEASGGRIGSGHGGLRFLILTTTGVKSGKKRRVPLAAVPFGDGYLVVASFGGSSTDPFWLINIRHDPFVDVRVGRIVTRAKASIIESSDYMYKEMWAKAVSVYNGFNEYKKATTRNIPIVVLHRV